MHRNKQNIQNQHGHDQMLSRDRKGKPKVGYLLPRDQGVYRYQDPYLTKRKDVLLRNRQNELQNITFLHPEIRENHIILLEHNYPYNHCINL